ncbi:MAG: hypothetical protein HQK65_17035 [Desulfamplus sp.]|nr:hypothetical protein [Desulfamplus sp.]
MENERLSIEDYIDGEDEMEVFHGEIIGGEYAREILEKNVNERLKKYWCASADEHYDKHDMEKQNPYPKGECYSHYNQDNGSIWTIVITPTEYHFFCNELKDGHDLMIDIVFGGVFNFNHCKKHFFIKTHHNFEEMETLPFRDYIRDIY